MKQICIVAGARPNFMKVAPIIREMERVGLPYYLVNTGQHYDKNMAEIFFSELAIPEPKYNLGVGSGSHAVQTASIMVAFEKVLMEEETSLVLVVGDINSTLACSLTASKLHIPVAHVEAGLRSLDRSMPEEINRILTDSVSDFLFTHSPEADVNLLREGVAEEKIFFVGNVMIDSLTFHLPEIEKSQILSTEALERKKYGLVTLHRPSNVDDPLVLYSIFEHLFKHSPDDFVLFFPIHPRTRNRIEAHAELQTLLKEHSQKIRFVEPLGYYDFQCLLKNALFVLSDSGGVQEEALMYDVPCALLRENTERNVCVTLGTTELISATRLGKFFLLFLLENGRRLLGFLNFGMGRRRRELLKYWEM